MESFHLAKTKAQIKQESMLDGVNEPIELIP